MSNKIKLVIAIVLFVIAIGALAFYFMSSRESVPEEMRFDANPETDAPMPPEENVFEQ